MIIVNVGRSTRASTPPGELEEAIRGDWPMRGRENVEDVRSWADLLVGTRAGRIVAVYRVQHIEPADGHRWRATVLPTNDESQQLVGQKLPDSLRWRPGENWPVKRAPIGAFGELPAGRTVTIGGWRLTITSVGDAELEAPPGKRLTVTTAS
jgi:hypothetical protein